MTYIENNLLENETIIYNGKVHAIYTFVVSLGILMGLMMFLPLFLDGGNIGSLIIGGPIALFFIYQLLYILSTEIVVTNKRVLYKTGFISRNIFELPLNRIESAVLNQTIFERIIDSGTLVVSGTGGHNKPIIHLSNPASMKAIVYQKMENI